jgi:hypothetical protein
VGSIQVELVDAWENSHWKCAESDYHLIDEDHGVQLRVEGVDDMDMGDCLQMEVALGKSCLILDMYQIRHYQC